MSDIETSGQKHPLVRALTYPFRMLANILLMVLIPHHIKRMVFLVTIQLRLSDEHLLRVSSLERLNAKMNIAQNLAVLKAARTIGTRIPLDQEKMSEFVTTGMGGEGICFTDQAMNNSAKLLVDGSPSWLNYGGERMIQDITQLISPCRAEAA